MPQVDHVGVSRKIGDARQEGNTETSRKNGGVISAAAGIGGGTGREPAMMNGGRDTAHGVRLPLPVSG